MRGRIEVEIGIKVMDVPPEEVESFLLAFAKIAANSHGVVNLDPKTQKVIEGMPAVQKALEAAPEEPDAVDGVFDPAQAIQESIVERRHIRLSEQKRMTAERKAEAIAARRLQHQDARDVLQAEKDKEWSERKGRRAEKDRQEREKVKNALADAQFCVTKAAHRLDMSSAGLYMKMNRLGIYSRKTRAERR